MIVKPAYRTEKVQEYYFSQKLAQIDRMRREGSDVINLGIGSPDQAPSENTVICSYFRSKKTWLSWISELFRYTCFKKGIFGLV